MSWTKDFILDLKKCEHICLWDSRRLEVGYSATMDDYWAHVEAEARAFADGILDRRQSVGKVGSGTGRELVKWVKLKLSPLPHNLRKEAGRLDHVFYAGFYFMSRCPFCDALNYHVQQKLLPWWLRVLKAF